MKVFLLIILFASLHFNSLAQDFEVPKNYKFKTAEDYAPYENDVISGINWITETPLNEETNKRQEVNKFLIAWLGGSPYVKITIVPEIVTFLNTTPDLLMVFLGGWARYSLQTKDFSNSVKGNQAGIEAVMEFYTKNRDFIKKDKNVEKYLKMNSNGTLDAYLEENGQIPK